MIFLGLSEPWFPCLSNTYKVLGKIYNLFNYPSSVRLTLLAVFYSGGLITLLKLIKQVVCFKWHSNSYSICLIQNSISYCHCKIFIHLYPNFLIKIRQWNIMVRSSGLESDSSWFTFQPFSQPFSNLEEVSQDFWASVTSPIKLQ